MRTSFVLVALGSSVLTAGFILACSDDASSQADAANPVCDCPASEPPISTDRLRTIEATRTVEPVQNVEFIAACPTGGIALSGGCAQVPPVIGVQLQHSRREGNSAWNCRWANRQDPAAPATVVASVLCLMPAAK